MYRKKGMERIQDSLLQDLEKVTSTLKNNPGNSAVTVGVGSGGNWRLNKPIDDPTISSTPSYSTAKVAKRYSPQYYVNDEPLYQNEMAKRSQSNNSFDHHDYAAINGRGSSTPTTPLSPRTRESGGIISNNHAQYHQKPFSYTRTNDDRTLETEEDVISKNISIIDSLLDDLNGVRLSNVDHHHHQQQQQYYQNAKPIISPAFQQQQQKTLPMAKTNQKTAFTRQQSTTTTTQPIQNFAKSLERHVTFFDIANSNPNTNNDKQAQNGHLTNGGGGGLRHQLSSDSDQVNMLIQDLEYSLKNNTQSTTPNSYNRTSSTLSSVNKPTTPTIYNGNSTSAMSPRSISQSPTRSAIVQPVSEYNRQLVNITPQKARMDNNPVVQVALPHGTTASNATRELDDLMASLSDFKMNQMKTPKTNYVALGRVQVPLNKNSKLLHSDDLDSMIGTLELDLNKQGVNTGIKGNCAACGKSIVGQVITALGTTWHPEHFVCTKCQEELSDRNFFERDGHAYCEEDYHKLFSPQCNYCKKPIYDRCITALDKTWHPEHFICAHCGKNFGDEGYHEKAGNAYCKEDFFKLFAPKCSGCAKPIVDNFVTALGGQWHSDCFVCKDCNSPFTDGKSYFDFEGRPYCETHYYDKRGTLCASCRQPITGRCITAMFQKYHPEHFICSFCLKQLNKGTFKKHNEKPYCHSCFDKLFA